MLDGRGEDDVAMSSPASFSSYEQACPEHRWEVPERYNIAADVCDKHPREKLVLPATPETPAAFFGTWKTGPDSSRPSPRAEESVSSEAGLHTL